MQQICPACGSDRIGLDEFGAHCRDCPWPDLTNTAAADHAVKLAAAVTLGQPIDDVVTGVDACTLDDDAFTVRSYTCTCGEPFDTLDALIHHRKKNPDTHQTKRSIWP